MYDTFWILKIDFMAEFKTFDTFDDAIDYVKQLLDDLENDNQFAFTITRSLIYHAEADDLDDDIDDDNIFDEFEDDEEDDYDDFD